MTQMSFDFKHYHVFNLPSLEACSGTGANVIFHPAAERSSIKSCGLSAHATPERIPVRHHILPAEEGGRRAAVGVYVCVM